MSEPTVSPDERAEPAVNARCAACGHTWWVHHAYDYGAMRHYPTACDHWSQCLCKTFAEVSR